MSDLLLMANALRDALRPRRLAIALLLTLVPPLLGLGYRLLTPAASYVPNDVYDGLVVGLVFSFTLAILSVVNGTGVVSQEIEGRTIVYLLTRPFPRWRILLAKWLVALFVTGVVVTLSTLLLALAVYGPARFADAGTGADIRALLMGTVAYSALFLLLGTAIPRPLTYGLLFLFGWETWVPKLPGQFARISIMTYLRTISQREISGEGGQNNGNFLLAFARAPEINISQPLAWTILWLVTLVCVVGAIAIFSTREYAPREDAE
jgi:ABC-2 type transport system permease protein